LAKKNDTISSTEKLLDLIRGRKTVDSGSSPAAVSKPVNRKTPPGRPAKPGRFSKPGRPSKPEKSLRPGRPSKIVSTAVQKAKRPRSILPNVLAIRQKTTIGVSVGYQDVKLVKVGQGPEKSRVLLNYKIVPFPAQLTTESAQFPLFLKRVLAQFCGDETEPEIWSAISSAKVEMRYLRIPKVPRKQIANTVYWTFKRDVTFDEQENIFDFVLLGDAIEEGIRKTEVMAYTAPRAEVNQLRESFEKSGYPLSGITIVPFLLQNLLRNRWLEVKAKNVCALYIGRDWSRIDIFSNGNLVLSRGVKAGMRSMIESIRQHITEDPEDESGSLETDTGPEADEARRIFFSFINDSQFQEGPPTGHFSDQDILRMLSPALERLIRQVERTLEHYAMKFDSSGIDSIFISGPINTQQLMVDQIGRQLDLAIDVFDPMGSDSPISGDIAPPETRAEREAFLPAVGLALSSGEQTPNFIFTYRDKDRTAKSQRLNQSLFAVLLAIMTACAALYFWQYEQVDKKEAKVFALQRELDAFTPRIDQDLIGKLLERVKKRQQALKEIGTRYKPVAVINEVSRLTPGHIRLLSITIDRVPAEESSNPRRLLRIEGVIFGDRLTFESALAEYLVKLETSPLLKNFAIQKRAFAYVEDKEVLRFTAQMEIG
jgi:Tfp pilus assembly PilM family ATPase